jgi:hypothetical protein
MFLIKSTFVGKIFLCLVAYHRAASCCPLVPKFAGSNPAEAVGFFGQKILSTPSFGGEVKPSVPCRALRHVKEPKSDMEVATFGKISRPFLAHSSTFRCWVR